MVASGAEKTKRFTFVGEVHTDEGRIRRTRALITIRGAFEPFYDQFWTDLGGNFKYKNLPAGTYVVTADTIELGRKRETVEISSSFADSKGQVRHVFLLERNRELGGQQVSVQQLSFPEKAWKIYRKAQDKQGEGKIEEAEKLLARALEVDPNFTWALNDLGVIAFQTGRFEKAKGHFLAARGTDSQAYPPLVNLGGVLVTLHEYKVAIQINQEQIDRGLMTRSLFPNWALHTWV